MMPRESGNGGWPVDAQILTAMRSAGSVSGAELAQRLGISRAAIWARIEELRRLGYEIAASPHEGYRLIAVPDVIHADDMRSRLPDSSIIGRDIRVFQETTSTNDIVEKLARDGVREGVAVFAEKQTKGRGRLGRSWFAPARLGLWFSVLLRPALTPMETTRVTVGAATALRRAVEIECGVNLEIKWPNDLLWKGRKVVGILTELRAELDRVKYVILGIGADVNIKESEFPPELRGVATSLRQACGRSLRRADLAARMLQELDGDYARVCRGEFEAVAEEWGRHCSTLGRQVVIRSGPRVWHGRAEALDSDGALLLRTQHGHLERIIGGDVTVES